MNRLSGAGGETGVGGLERTGRRGHAVEAAPLTGGTLAATRDAVGRLQLEWDRGQRRHLEADLGGQLVGVLLLGHADRAHCLGIEELAYDRLLGAEQHLAGAEHGQVLVVERSEEHTSELQSLMRISYAVFCLKKKKTQ